MNADQVIDVMRGLMVMAGLVAGPVMLAGMLTGIVMGILQSATQIQGPWSDVAGASSPYSVTNSAVQKFFSLH